MITAGADITSVYHAATTLRFYNGRVRIDTPLRSYSSISTTRCSITNSRARPALTVRARMPARRSRVAVRRVRARARARSSRNCTSRSWPGGERSIEAREERFRRLFAAAGRRQVERRRRGERPWRIGRRTWRHGARSSGALALLAALKPHVRIGIVSNNLLEEQQGKIALCGFETLRRRARRLGSGGRRQARPGDLRDALRELSVRRRDAVMIGDSWTADIAGARAAGIRPIWFNRRTVRRPPDHLASVRSPRSHRRRAVLDVIFETSTPVRHRGRRPVRIGIDLGGTKIEAIALDGDGRERFRQRVATPRGDYRATIEAVASLVTRAEAVVGDGDGRHRHARRRFASHRARQERELDVAERAAAVGGSGDAARPPGPAGKRCELLRAVRSRPTAPRLGCRSCSASSSVPASAAAWSSTAVW